MFSVPTWMDKRNWFYNNVTHHYQMTKETLKSKIQLAIPGLLEMVKESCTNVLSENLVYLVSEIKDSKLNFNEERKIRIAENNAKTPVSFDKAVNQLLEQYENLHDVNLFVHKAEKTRTVIDIRFYPKTSLNLEYQESVLNNPPMLHCKISNPMYHEGSKFDLNWEHGGIKHKWKLFWYRKKLKKEIEYLKNSG